MKYNNVMEYEALLHTFFLLRDITNTSNADATTCTCNNYCHALHHHHHHHPRCRRHHHQLWTRYITVVTICFLYDDHVRVCVRRSELMSYC